jgi:hypothetical protein
MKSTAQFKSNNKTKAKLSLKITNPRVVERRKAIELSKFTTARLGETRQVSLERIFTSYNKKIHILNNHSKHKIHHQILLITNQTTNHKIIQIRIKFKSNLTNPQYSHINQTQLSLSNKQQNSLRKRNVKVPIILSLFLFASSILKCKIPKIQLKLK